MFVWWMVVGVGSVEIKFSVPLQAQALPLSFSMA
jgi:hypothetical protein